MSPSSFFPLFPGTAATTTGAATTRHNSRTINLTNSRSSSLACSVLRAGI
jgi:hypothetical protein